MDERKHILVVDDDPGIRNSLSAFLTRSGFEVTLAQDGQHALDILPKTRPDLILLDVMMPHLDGRETIRRLRREGSWLPVILLTQVGDATERAMALEEGADDYLNKPFEPHELVARIRAVLRRATVGTPPLSAAWILTCGDLKLDRRARRATLQGREITLTPKALLLLEHLMTHPDELISRDRLLDAVWGWEQAVATRAVDARIAELRRALNDNADAPLYIDTIAGMGYRFVGKVERAG
ncbi:MAG TPA: response regulator transcription factor [Anaerolineales bacterium]|nr:response regulator transcription factor [Anaerolineales bacterium]